MNINSALELFMIAKAGMSYNENYLKMFTWTINLLIETIGDLEIEAVTVTDLRKFRASIAQKKTSFDSHPTRPTEEHPLSPYTILGHVRRLRVFFNWLMDEELLTASPARRLELPRLEKLAPKDMPQDDIINLITHSENIRDEAIIKLLADSGCRVGGLARLNLDDLDFNLVDGRAKARVVEKRRERAIFFCEDTVNSLQSWLKIRQAKPGENAVFTSLKTRGRLTGSGIYQVMKRTAKVSGVTKYNPHSMRHATARRMIEAGGSIEDVSAVLGHTTSDVTRLFYSGWNDKDTRRRHAKYANLGGGQQ